MKTIVTPQVQFAIFLYDKNVLNFVVVVVEVVV